MTRDRISRPRSSVPSQLWASADLRIIDQEIYEQIPDGCNQDNGLHLRVIAAKNPIQTVFTKARNHEDLLGDDRSAKEGASLQSQDGDYGYQRVAQSVFRDHGAFRESF